MNFPIDFVAQRFVTIFTETAAETYLLLCESYLFEVIFNIRDLGFLLFLGLASGQLSQVF